MLPYLCLFRSQVYIILVTEWNSGYRTGTLWNSWLSKVFFLMEVAIRPAAVWIIIYLHGSRVDNGLCTRQIQLNTFWFFLPAGISNYVMIKDKIVYCDCVEKNNLQIIPKNKFDFFKFYVYVIGILLESTNKILKSKKIF